MTTRTRLDRRTNRRATSVPRGGGAAPGLALLAVALGSLVGCGPAASGSETGADGEFYAGRVLEIIVPFGPGGGTDVWTRILVPHLQARLGPRSAVQVVNIPGASSLAGANDFAMRRRPDGYTALATAASTVIASLLGEPMARYDFRRFVPVIGSPLGGVVYASPQAGGSGVAALRGQRIRVTYGGLSAVGLDLVPLLAFELLGLDVNPILGYPDRGATRLALQRGEIDLDFQTIPAYVANVSPLVRDGDAVPLFSLGITEGGEVVRDPAVPDVPTVRDVYVDLFGREPEGVEWDAYKAVLALGVSTGKVLWLHADAPAPAVEALRSAARDMAVDPRFIEIARADVGDYPFYLGEEVTQAMASASRATPETVAWLQGLLARKYGIDRLRPAF